jgi:rhodanese-related sulfurtransferase
MRCLRQLCEEALVDPSVPPDQSLVWLRIGALLVLGLFATFLSLKLWRRHQFLRELRMSPISVEELVHLREEIKAPLLIDARSSASRARDGVIPGAIAFEQLTQDPEQRCEGEVVVYCACPNDATSARLAKRLMTMGFRPVRPLAGGIDAWQDAGLAVERP